MLTKKHKIMIGIGLLVVMIIAIGGFLYYQFAMKPENQVSNNTQTIEAAPKSSAGDSDSEKPDIKVQMPSKGITSIPVNGGGTLTICQDKCGDGVCQIKDAACPSGDLNCVCAETHEKCPQDCK